MINKLKLFFLFLIATFFTIQAQGQKYWTVAAGASFPEALHVSAKYRINNAQIGLSIGFLPEGKDKITKTYTAGYDYYFGKEAQKSAHKAWFVGGYLNVFTYRENDFQENYLYLITRIGRELHITPRFGCRVGLGFGPRLAYSNTRNNEPIIVSLPKFVPSLDLQFFYKFSSF